MLLVLHHQRVSAVLKPKEFVFMPRNKQENTFKKRYAKCKFYHLLMIIALIHPSFAPWVYNIEYITFLQMPGKEGVNSSWKITLCERRLFYESGSKILSLVLKLLSQPDCASKRSHLAEYMISKMNIC